MNELLVELALEGWPVEAYCDLCETEGHTFRTCPARDDHPEPAEALEADADTFWCDRCGWWHSEASLECLS